MGGTVAISIIKPNGTCINNVTYTEAEQELFFCKQYINNDFEGAIEKILKVMEQYNNKFLDKNPNTKDRSNILAPHSYGLIVIDFEKKIIRNMQNYNLPAHKEFINYYNDLANNRIEPFITLTIDDSLLIKDINTKEHYSFTQFFGSTDPKKILKIMKYVFENRHLERPNKEFSGLEHLKIFSYDNPVFNDSIRIIPKNLDFQLIHYTEQEIGLLLNHLSQEGHKFSQEEKDIWIHYIEQSIMDQLEENNPTLNEDQLAALALKTAKTTVDSAFKKNPKIKTKATKK